MDYPAKLALLVKENNGIITTKEAELYDIPRHYLTLFVTEGKLHRVSQGLYVSPDSFEDPMYQIQCRSEKIVFSHETALYIHDLTDRDPLQYSVTVPRGYGVARLQKSELMVYTVKKELHELGRETTKTVHGRTISVYNLERTICDITRHRNQMDADMFSTALKRYATRRDQSLPRLMEYAKPFRVEKVLRQYMGVLL